MLQEVSIIERDLPPQETQAGPIYSAAGSAPTLAIVIPVFKHPVLITDAMASALREARQSNGVIVIVNDGCPYPQTHDICLAFALAEPGLVEYIRTPNGGLSAARNRGIKHALACFPRLQTIYLLDADNRLTNGAMRRAHATMREAQSDWVYPNIDKFGMEWSGNYSDQYSILRHLFQNICEAGSLIHRRIFDAGVFFDESMKQGYEDWEFWLQCVDAGFRGAPCAAFGFQYRARRESMVRDSDRDGNAILAYMHRKHKRLYSWKNILRLEHREAPRFCVVDTANQRFMMTSIPGEMSHTAGVVEVDALFWGSSCYPSNFHFPHFMVFVHEQIMLELVRAHIADWVFWQIEDLLENHSFVYVFLDYQKSDISVSVETRTRFEDVNSHGPFLVATSYKCMWDCALDSYTDWIDSIWKEYPEPSVGTITISAPFSSGALGGFGTDKALHGLFSLFKQLRKSPFKHEPSWDWRSQDALFPKRSLFRNVRHHMHAQGPIGAGALSPQNEIAILLPVVSFGGVEQVGIQIARQFHAAGWRTRLVVTEGSTIKDVARLNDIFDTILFLNDPQHANWNPSGYTYFGHDLQKWAAEGRVERLIGLIAGCAAVVNCHAMHGNEVMGMIRRQGVVTITSMHLIDRDKFMAPQGHLYWLLAYEHAYDFIAAPSRKLLAFCGAAGIPEEKLVYLPNAPTFEVNEKIREKRLRALGRTLEPDAVPRKLRVLSIGRLDRQKGGERLTALVSAVQSQNLPIEWRFVGGRVLEDGGSESGLTVEPPVYERSAIMERLLWADAVVMLSHWEGSPLLILEAQSVGTIPIATDVGAVSEMIVDGVDGILLENTALGPLLSRAIAELAQLADNPLLRVHIARSAMKRVKDVNWASSVVGLIETVGQVLQRKI